MKYIFTLGNIVYFVKKAAQGFPYYSNPFTIILDFKRFFGQKFCNNLQSLCVELPTVMSHVELYCTILTFNNPEKKKAFENKVGKGENAGKQHFLLFPQCFLLFQKQIPNKFANKFLFFGRTCFVVCKCFQCEPV